MLLSVDWNCRRMRKTARHFHWFLLKAVGILGSCRDISGEYVLMYAGSCVLPPKCICPPRALHLGPFLSCLCVLFSLPVFFHLWRMFVCPLVFLSPYPAVPASTVERSPSCHLPFLIFLLPFTLLIVRLTQRNNTQSFNLTEFRVVSQGWQSVYFYFKGFFVPRFLNLYSKTLDWGVWFFFQRESYSMGHRTCY